MVDDRPERLKEAVLRCVAYGDVFDHPLSAREIHRYLEAVPASLDEVEATAEELLPNRLGWSGDHYAMPGREHLSEIRRRREAVASELWPHALRCGRAIARVPFVRMVALTGALAMDNVDDGADLDYLIVTEPGRVWLARAMIIQLVRINRLRGVTICPNWILSEDTLGLERRDLFAARELLQMVPISGFDVYRRMIEANPWTFEILPNAAGRPRQAAADGNSQSLLGRAGERLLGAGIGNALELWERRRKTREIRRISPDNPEVVLDHRQCKGHVDRHGQRIARAYEERLRALSLD
jgi:hypothetical protein